MNPVIEYCLRVDPQTPTTGSVAQWWPRHLVATARWPSPIQRAIAGGFDADRVGWAFASGYQAALRALEPDLPDDAIAAFCVTEEGGNRPRDIRTRFTAHEGGWRATGAKRWTTLGPDSTLLLVAGTLDVRGDDGARPLVRVARVPAHAPGVRLEPMPETRFVPEVPHARVHLDDVELPDDALLPGDGYDDYVKPFRTIEDAHVTAAVLAYLLREGRARGWEAPFVERIVAALAAFVEVARGAPGSPATHVALAGALQWARELYAQSSPYWDAAADDPAAARWRRDSALFDVAGPARALRAQRAWERLAGNPASDGPAR